MSANDLMGRYADVQMAVAGLLQMSRLVREQSTPSPIDLKLIEDGLFEVGHELLEIAADLRVEAEALQARDVRSITMLEQCQALLAKYEQQAVENGLVPAILTDRVLRGAPAESYDTDRYDVIVDQAAGVVVVREKHTGPLPENVVELPTGLAREIYRQGRTQLDHQPGGAA